MKLDTEFCKLAIRFDAGRLASEVSQFIEAEWRTHPQGHAGNSALPLIAVHGDPSDDGVRGPMGPTPELQRCPYLRQVLAALGVVLGRTRLMRIVGHGEATAHVDTNYYWMQRVRVHVPIVTFPEVEFLCGARSVHMAAGETWLFDTWRLHNVLNHCDGARIHLVADTVGSASFWDLADRTGRSSPDGRASCREASFVPYNPGHDPVLETEAVNFPVVMSPWEQQCLIASVLEDLTGAEEAEPTTMADLEAALETFHRDWRAQWAAHGDRPSGWPAFRRMLDRVDGQLGPLQGRLTLPNDLDVVEALRQAVVRPAINPDLAEERAPTRHVDKPKMRGDEGNDGHATVHPAPGTSITSRAPSPAKLPPCRFDRPVFIVSAPRSGSTLLFETLARSPGFWTVGGESHAVIESIPQLNTVLRGFDSNRLTGRDADPATGEALRGDFLALLRDRDGRRPPADAETVRMLEKTPKNALRIPFLDAVFPEALFIYLYREPRGNLSSILEAWRSGRFITYPDLPGWEGTPWSLLLIPGWRDLRGASLEAIAAAQWAASHRTILADLAGLPGERWTTITYDDLLADPQGQMEWLSAFAGVPWDQKLEGPLPLSRYTVTPPHPRKWRRNATEVESVMPTVAEVSSRAEQVVNDPARRRPAAVPPTPLDGHASPIGTSKGNDDDLPPGELQSVHTANFPDLLDALGISLLVTTYQAGKLIAVRADVGKLNTHFRNFPMPMGLAFEGGRLAMGTGVHVWEFRDQPEVGRKLEPSGRHDACFLPRSCHVTGDIRIHDVAWAGDELWVVNTQFSCLCTLERAYSFVPRWRPPFVKALAPEDRCHLNGLAVVDGRPRYVTVLGQTDTAGGWRVNKANGGCLLEVPSGEVLIEGLSMPHSPRWHDGKLWVLESGEGTLSVVDLERGRAETVATVPGFTRGLDFFGHFAFIGLSQVRESAVFSGIPITERLKERTCGVWVVDLRTGGVVAFLRFDEGVQEIFAVQVLPGIRFPEILDDEKLIGSSFVLPDEALADVPRAVTSRETVHV